ncbi:MAG TPA: hypothetical protein VF762_14525 [Blastocatellia bacterium]
MVVVRVDRARHLIDFSVV